MEENQWTIPPANLQRRHGVKNYACCILKGSFQFIILKIPCAAERLGPAFQQNMRALEQAEAEQDATVQNCFCPLCSDVQRTQALPATEYPPVELDPSVSSPCDGHTIPLLIASLKNGPLHLNQYQNARDLAETAVIVPDHARVPQIAVRAYTYTAWTFLDALT